MPAAVGGMDQQSETLCRKFGYTLDRLSLDSSPLSWLPEFSDGRPADAPPSIGCPLPSVVWISSLRHCAGNLDIRWTGHLDRPSYIHAFFWNLNAISAWVLFAMLAQYLRILCITTSLMHYDIK